MAISFGKDGLIKQAHNPDYLYPESYSQVYGSVNGSSKRIISAYSNISGTNTNLIKKRHYWDRYKITSFEDTSFTPSFPTFYFSYPTSTGGTMDVPYTGGRLSVDWVYSSYTFNPLTGLYSGVGAPIYSNSDNPEAIMGYWVVRDGYVAKLSHFVDEWVQMWDGCTIGNGMGYEYSIFRYANPLGHESYVHSGLVSDYMYYYPVDGYNFSPLSYDSYGNSTPQRSLTYDYLNSTWYYVYRGQY